MRGNKMREPKEIEINGKTLDIILEEHKHWLNKDIEDCEDIGTSLRHADLRGAILRDVNLRGADLCGTDLSYADLSGANLRGTDLYYADLRDAILRGADLSNADLIDANLCCADLNNANLSNANLSGANLCGANIRNTKGSLIEYRKGKILTETIIGYKKCINDIIVTLEIPRGAIVFSINGNKCRTNKAKVIAIDGSDRAFSQYKYMSYYIGDEFTIYDFNCEYNQECAEGIHFFMTRKEAENNE